MQYLFLLPLFLLLGLKACKEPAKVQKPYYHMDEEFRKTFLQGGQGSYWIYTDSLETTYDTVTLVKLSKGNGMEDGDYEAEDYATHYKATNSTNYFTTLATRHTLFTGETEYETYYRFRMATSTGVEKDLTLRDGKYEPAVQIQKIDSVNLMGKTYYNVVKLGGAGGFYRTIIIQPDIGIIYKEASVKRPIPTSGKKLFLIDYQLK